MIINQNNKFIFLSVPKTGSTSIMEQLDPQIGHQPPHVYHAKMSDLTEDLVAEYRVFLFHRNPLERFASTFFDGLNNDGHKQVWSESLEEYRDKFREFCSDFESLPIKDDIHFIPQWRFIDSNFPQTQIYTYSFEDWEQSIESINNEFKLSLDPKVHKRPSNRPPISELFDKDSELIIRSYYKEDFRIFDYA